jgi:hypothetical protein
MFPWPDEQTATPGLRPISLSVAQREEQTSFQV